LAICKGRSYDAVKLHPAAAAVLRAVLSMVEIVTVSYGGAGSRREACNKTVHQGSTTAVMEAVLEAQPNMLIKTSQGGCCNTRHKQPHEPWCV